MKDRPKVNRHSVISQGHYVGLQMPKETLSNVMDGRDPRILMDIHDVSGVNKPEIHLSELPGPAHSSDFQQNDISRPEEYPGHSPATLGNG